MIDSYTTCGDKKITGYKVYISMKMQENAWDAIEKSANIPTFAHASRS